MNSSSSFMKKNAVTVIILAATIVLAGIALFTAVRLYQLRQQPVSPNQPGSTPSAQGCPVLEIPKTREYKTSDSVDVVKLISGGPVEYRWEGTLPTDANRKFGGAEGTLQNGQTLTISYPAADQWGPKDENGAHEVHVVLHLTGSCGYRGENWDRWFHNLELSTTIPSQSPSPSASPSPSPSGTPIASPSPSGSPSPTPPWQVQACSILSFTLTSQTSTPTASPSVTPTATPTEPPRGGNSPTPTPTTSSTPSGTSTPKSSATPKVTTTPKASASATPASLPAAGVGLPTMLGIGAGFLLLIGAVLLAL